MTFIVPTEEVDLSLSNLQSGIPVVDKAGGGVNNVLDHGKMMLRTGATHRVIEHHCNIEIVGGQDEETE